MFAPLAKVFRPPFRPVAADGPDIEWGLVLLYLAAAGACVWAAIKEHAAQKQTYEPRVSRFWMIVGVLLGLMGLARLVGLQDWLDNTVRSALRSQGTYEERRPMQTLLVVQAIALGLLALGVAVWFARKYWRQYLVPTISMGMLVIVVAVRAISLHGIDHAMASDMCIGITLGGLLESLPILLTGGAAGWAIRRDWAPKMRAYETRVRIR
jgi:hypothetical protein